MWFAYSLSSFLLDGSYELAKDEAKDTGKRVKIACSAHMHNLSSMCEFPGTF
jgi:hypothetical protein